VIPYPDPATIYHWSVIADPGDDMFEDIYLCDMWVYHLPALDAILTICHRVQVNKRISRHCLLVDPIIKGNLRGLIERGVQESMDKEEVFNETMEVAIGYAGSLGASLWSKIKEDRAQVGPGYGVVVVDWLTMDLV
jgi:hypothetical protein